MRESIVTFIEKNSERIICTEGLDYLRGYLVEALFLEKYKKKFESREFSTEWWCFAKNDLGYGGYKDITFVVFKDFKDLNKIDKRIINRLLKSNAGKKYKCKMVTIENNILCEYEFILESGGENKNKVRPIKTSRKLRLTEEKILNFLTRFECDKAAKHEYIDFMKEMEILQGKAVQLIKERAYRSNYYKVYDLKANMDIIGEDFDGTPIYYEIKSKNPEFMKRGMVWIKRFQVEIADIFMKSKMLAKNVIGDGQTWKELDFHVKGEPFLKVYNADSGYKEITSSRYNAYKFPIEKYTDF